MYIYVFLRDIRLFFFNRTNWTSDHAYLHLMVNKCVLAYVSVGLYNQETL